MRISRQIADTELIPTLLDLVDAGKIALRPAVELSYLSPEIQKNLADSIDYNDATPSHAQAIKMRKFADEGKLTPEVIESIMCEEKPNQREKLHIGYSEVRKYIPDSVPYEKTGEYIFKALEYYRDRMERQRNNRDSR